jgi:hypothetical protein
MVVLNHLSRESSLLPATFQDTRFGIKLIFLSKIEIIDGGEGINSSHGSPTHKRFPFHLPLFTYS